LQKYKLTVKERILHIGEHNYEKGNYYMFDFSFMLETFPLWQALLSMVSIIILVPLMVIITGFILGKTYYYLIKKISNPSVSE